MAEEFEKKDEVFDRVLSDTASDESAYYKKPEKEFVIDIESVTDDIPDYNPDIQTGTGYQEKRRMSAKVNKRIKQGSGCVTTAIYTVVILVISVLLASFVIIVMNDMMGLVKDDEDKIINIPEGATLSEVADILQDMDVIDIALGLNLYAKVSGDSDIELKVGDVTVNPKMGYSSLLNVLKKSTKKEIVTVTVIEGKTVKQIAEQLEENGICKAADFIYEIQNGDYTSYDFIADIPENEDRLIALEGYIFPDTYDFYKDEEPKTVVKKFLKNFNDRFDEDLRNLAEDRGMSVDDVVKLASIVQKEGTTAGIMRKVSSVFQNRLENSDDYPYLQSNATLSYSTGKAIIWYTEEDISTDDPYNSYTNKGLPPSAICNPGLNAIKAVLNPDNTDYYYFVTDDDGLYYFSETARRHEEQVSSIRETGVGLEGTAEEA